MKYTTKKLVPKLRFPGFTDEWQVNKLASLCDMRAGKFLPADAIKVDKLTGTYPCYGGNGLRGYVKSHTHNGSYSLIGRQGALCGNVRYVSDEFYATEHAVVVYPKPIVSSKWLYFQLNRLELNRYATGQAQPGLSVDTVLAIKQSNPNNKTEQVKIAEFLTVVDEKIALFEQKVELLKRYKKGVMQKIFTQQIRFKDKNGQNYPDWVTKSLAGIAGRVLARNNGGSIKFVLTNSATQGVVSQDGYFNKDIANQNNLTNYHVVSKDDFVYNPRVSVNAPVGPINRNHLAKGVMSPLYSVFRLKLGNLNFLEQYFNTSYWHNYLKGVANNGARHDRMNITNEDLYNMPIPFPVPEEQQKIADFLFNIDEKIAQEEKKLKLAKNFKKSLLQRMFV